MGPDNSNFCYGSANGPVQMNTKAPTSPKLILTVTKFKYVVSMSKFLLHFWWREEAVKWSVLFLTKAPVYSANRTKHATHCAGETHNFNFLKQAVLPATDWPYGINVRFRENGMLDKVMSSTLQNDTNLLVRVNKIL